MSNPRHGLCACVVMLGALVASTAHADNPMETWARWVASQRGTWKGQTVAFPDPEARPELPLVRCAEWRSLCVHASADTDPRQVDDALAALEAAQDLIALGGWPAAFPDGGRGGTQQHDVYLTDIATDAALGHLDAPYLDGNLDGAITFATLPAQTATDRLQACAVAALVEAALLGRDPAEAPAWRKATGAYVAWLATGEAGCSERAVNDQQAEPHRGWVTDVQHADVQHNDTQHADVQHVRHTGEGAALMLAMLGDRMDGGTGAFVRELWQLARQLTWEGQRLRGSPDLWEALDAALDNAHEKLPQLMEDFAVARYFARPGLNPPYPSLKAWPSDAVVAVTGPIARGALPAHIHAEQPLETFGSAYALVDATGLDPMGRLQVWLRGELGVEWSLVAVRLRADGTEAGRIVAPPRRDPRSFFPVELLGETSSVLLVVTNLGQGIPDADLDATRTHGFSLIVDTERP